MEEPSRAAGRCHCGAVKLLVTLPIKGCVHCHCGGCRQVHGAPLVTWFSIPRERLQISGREGLKWYRDKETSRRAFCTECGTHLLYVADAWPGDVHITRACLVNEIEISPRAHVAFDQRAPWFPFEDDLPRLASGMIPLPSSHPEEGS